jgi:transposase
MWLNITGKSAESATMPARAKSKIEALEQEIVLKDAKIKDLQNRLFGKKSEKGHALKSERGANANPPSRRPRGQQPGGCGHGRTQRSNLPVVHDDIDLSEDEKRCPQCGLLRLRNPALDEPSDEIEVEVSAHIRRYIRPAYTRHPGCTCEDPPAVITAPPPPRLIPLSPYGVSFWVEVIVGKYRYGQPTNRHLQDLSDQGFPVSPGTVAGGLQSLACANNGGKAPHNIDPFLPRLMDEAQRVELTRPYPSQAPPASGTEAVPIHDSL